MKRIISLALILMMVAMAAVVPVSAATGNTVYYDSATKWAENWTIAENGNGNTNGNGYQSTMAGFYFAGVWQNGNITDGKAYFANLAGGTNSFRLLNEALAADADYSPAYRKLSLAFRFDLSQVQKNSQSLWGGLEMAKAGILESESEGCGNFDSVRQALATYGTDEIILYLTDSVTGAPSDVNRHQYPVCSLSADEEHQIEYIFDSSTIYGLRVDGTVYTKTLDGTTIRGLGVRNSLNMQNVETAEQYQSLQYPSKSKMTFSQFKYEGIEELPELPPDDESKLSVLLIGCSYGTDTMTRVIRFLSALNREFVLGKMFVGSRPIGAHYAAAASNAAEYDYQVADSGIGSGNWLNQSGKRSIGDTLAERDWDVVIIQTTTGVCALPDTYSDASGNSYVELMANYVKNKAPNAKLLWNMVWADPAEVVGTATALDSYIVNQFGGNQLAMYNGIITAVQEKVMPYVTNGTLQGIIPNGTAIQNALGLGMTDADMYRDAVHLSSGSGNNGYGYYTAALTATCSILNVLEEGSATAEALAAAYPDSASISEEARAILTQAVGSALAYPFMSTASARKIIEAGVYNFRPAEIAGQNEDVIRGLLAQKLMATDVRYTGVNLQATDITASGYDGIGNFTFTVTFPDGSTTAAIPVTVSDVFTVTPKTPAGSIPTVGNLSFTFDQAMKADTLNPATVLLKEPVLGTENYNNRTYSYSYDEASHTYTMTFHEGDIAPMQQYVVEFTAAVQSQAGVVLDEPLCFVYTTRENGYYINDNFSRYATGAKLSHTSVSSTELLPWQYSTHTYPNDPTQIVEIDGEKAAYLKMKYSAQGTTIETFYGWGYRPDYLAYPEPSRGRNYYTEHELTFTFTAADTARYPLWGGLFVVQKAEDGQFYLHYASMYCANSLNGMKASTLIPLVPLTVSTAAEQHKINLRLVMYQEKNTSGVITRRLYKLWLNGEEVTEIVNQMGNETSATTMKPFPAEGIRLTNYAAQLFTYAQTASTGQMYFAASAVGDDMAEIWIYDVKYKPATMVTLATPVQNAAVTEDVVLQFAAPMKENTLTGITVVDDGQSQVAYTGTYDAAAGTYTLHFAKRPRYEAYYTITIPQTVLTTQNDVTDPVSYQLQFEKVPVKLTETGALDGTTLTKTVTITNNTGAALSGTLALAVYQGAKLLNVQKTPFGVAGESGQQTLTVSHNELAAGCTYKVMAFAEVDSLKPLAEAIGGTLN